MTNKRYNELMTNHEAIITEEEYALGWHFCPEFDGMLALENVTEGCICKLERGNDAKPTPRT